MACRSGRDGHRPYYAMDRDNRWLRARRLPRVASVAFAKFRSAEEAITWYYDHPTEPNMSGDEFVTPSVICDDGVTPRGIVRDGDSVLFYNYRGDRPRELTKAFVLPDFDGFDRGTAHGGKKLDLHYTTLTAYEQGLPVHVAYPKPPKMVNTLGEFVSANELRQFRCAETEKYAHVTFFFNDYREAPFPGEERQMAPSPQVSTYDQQPEMSAYQITEIVLKRINANVDDLVVVNFANGDMVGQPASSPPRERGRARRRLRRRILEATQRQAAWRSSQPTTATASSDRPSTAARTRPTHLRRRADRRDDRSAGKSSSRADAWRISHRRADDDGLAEPVEMNGRSLIPSNN